MFVAPAIYRSSHPLALLKYRHILDYAAHAQFGDPVNCPNWTGASTAEWWRWPLTRQRNWKFLYGRYSLSGLGLKLVSSISTPSEKQQPITASLQFARERCKHILGFASNLFLSEWNVFINHLPILIVCYIFFLHVFRWFVWIASVA